MEVIVLPPEIAGDTVVFRWEQSVDNPYQRRNEFFFRYEGLDLGRFSQELLLEIFLGLQLRVFGGYNEPVAIEMPIPVSSRSARFWSAFNRADNVAVSPLRAESRFSPWHGRAGASGAHQTAGLYFGGGKDSMLIGCMFGELFGTDQVVLIQFVGPLTNSPGLANYLERRQERLMLEPARAALGFVTQRVWTDYQANFRKAGYRLRPNLELYSLGSLPVLLDRNVRLSSIAACWTTYPTTRNEDGSVRHGYERARPETIAAQSRHYRETFGFDHTVTNAVLPLTPTTAFWLLAERYPAALQQIVMCTNAKVDERWCYQCNKCAQFALFGLSLGVFDPRFDYDRLLRDSPFIHGLKQDADMKPAPKNQGNADWSPWFSDRRAFMMTCHLVARIDPREIPFALSDEATANLDLLRARYGKRLFPEYEAMPRSTLAVLEREIGPGLPAILSQHFETIDHVPGPFDVGGAPCDYIFDRPVELPIDAAFSDRD